MNKELYAIGLDLGTSSVKGVLLSNENKIVATGSRPFEYITTTLPNGSKYKGIDAKVYYSTVCSLIKALAENIPENAKCEGVSMVSASGNTLLCNDEGQPLIHAYSWTNEEMSEEVFKTFGKGFGDKVSLKAGWQFFNTFPLAHLSHIKVNAPDLLSSASRVCMTTEYLTYRLTGEWGIDYSTATPFYLLDQVKREWNKEYLKVLGIPEGKLPKLYPVGSVIGGLTENSARDCGLKVGTKVVLGSFDHPGAARALGVTKEGDLLISCGTSWVCFTPMKNRDEILNGKMLCDPFNSPNGEWAGMQSLTRFAERINEITEKYISNGKDKFDLLEKYSENSVSGAEGLSFNPREELPDLSNQKKENIARALMEGTARALKEHFNGKQFKKVAMAGGPSESRMWRKVFSEILGVEVVCEYGGNSGAVGAAKYVFESVKK